jgi:hypothetical protein
MPAIDTVHAPLVLRHPDGREQLVEIARQLGATPMT